MIEEILLTWAYLCFTHLGFHLLLIPIFRGKGVSGKDLYILNGCTDLIWRCISQCKCGSWECVTSAAKPDDSWSVLAFFSYCQENNQSVLSQILRKKKKHSNQARLSAYCSFINFLIFLHQLCTFLIDTLLAKFQNVLAEKCCLLFIICLLLLCFVWLHLSLSERIFCYTVVAWSFSLFTDMM